MMTSCFPLILWGRPSSHAHAHAVKRPKVGDVLRAASDKIMMTIASNDGRARTRPTGTFCKVMISNALAIRRRTAKRTHFHMHAEARHPTRAFLRGPQSFPKLIGGALATAQKTRTGAFSTGCRSSSRELPPERHSFAANVKLGVAGPKYEPGSL
ncbi:hypothetical protein NM208_g12237 [Fusarium decemcellulare]|uniref:Uncharacterized protein n=1 Tax=Fusarium decemcellulare TaxID=57161 RepID=A0ACC1RT01_9HYPO|nr:hypothetical protein NM208_g12237 [Fusarium decemcellulare]